MKYRRQLLLLGPDPNKNRSEADQLAIVVVSSPEFPHSKDSEMNTDQVFLFKHRHFINLKLGILKLKCFSKVMAYIAKHYNV
ncbi:hypothetical protein GCM10028868_29950 [Virgibacillus kimchii]